MIRTLRLLASTAALAIVLPVAARAQDQPVTPKTVAKAAQSDVHRAGKHTEKQAQRTGKSLARVVSRKARQGDYTADISGPSLKTDKPVTPKQFGLTVSGDVKRAGKQTSKQLQRTGKSIEKLVSRKARKGES